MNRPEIEGILLSSSGRPLAFVKAVDTGRFQFARTMIR